MLLCNHELAEICQLRLLCREDYTSSTLTTTTGTELGCEEGDHVWEGASQKHAHDSIDVHLHGRQFLLRADAIILLVRLIANQQLVIGQRTEVLQQIQQPATILLSLLLRYAHRKILHQLVREKGAAVRSTGRNVRPVVRPLLSAHAVLHVLRQDAWADVRVGRFPHTSKNGNDDRQTVRHWRDRENVLQNCTHISLLPEHAGVLTGRSNSTENGELLGDAVSVFVQRCLLSLYIKKEAWNYHPVVVIQPVLPVLQSRQQHIE